MHKTDAVRWPNLFYVGPEKTGTTTMYHILRGIRGMYVPSVKVTSYFTRHITKTVLPRCTFADPTRHLRYFPRSFTNESAASTMHATNSIMVNPFPPANPSHLDSTSMNTAVLHRLYSMTDI